MQPLIRVNDLHFLYRENVGHGIAAINGINLIIQEGEFVAIIGANGSGKSTLARHFNGLLQPTQGDVVIDGVNTRESTGRKDIQRKVVMVFQNPESQAVATTIEEDVAFGLENLGVPSDEIRRRIDDALQVVGLAGMQKRAPHHLSGGQKQRLALAGVLAMQPRCIVLDEATSMLDPSGRSGLKEIIKRLHAQGVTIVMITQDMDEAAMAERVVVLSQGRICRDDIARTVMADDVFLRSVGLDSPPIMQLARELHHRHPAFPGNLLTVNEIVEYIRRLYSSELVQAASNAQIPLDNGVDHGSSSKLFYDHVVMNGFIIAHNLRYTYMRGTPMETEALRGVDFNVQVREIVGVIGATGSGKSTLLQHLNGLLTLQAGELRIGSMNIAQKHRSLRTIRQQVALLFQQPEDQLFERYVADDVAYGPINLGFPLDVVRKRVESAMESAGLSVEVFRDRSIYSLSGGERRRTALAGVLALDPKVLVLDEASTGLDPRGRRDLIQLLRQWQAQGDRSIVWASHSMEEIAQVASRVAMMVDGRITFDGAPTQVFAQAEELMARGLDIPQVTQVMWKLRQVGIDAPDVLTVDEAIPVVDQLLM